MSAAGSRDTPGGVVAEADPDRPRLRADDGVAGCGCGWSPASWASRLSAWSPPGPLAGPVNRYFGSFLGSAAGKAAPAPFMDRIAPNGPDAVTAPDDKVSVRRALCGDAVT